MGAVARVVFIGHRPSPEHEHGREDPSEAPGLLSLSALGLKSSEGEVFFST